MRFTASPIAGTEVNVSMPAGSTLAGIITSGSWNCSRDVRCTMGQNRIFFFVVEVFADLSCTG